MDHRSVRPQTFVLAGKLVLLLAAAILGGQAYHRSVLANNEKARTITIEQYTATFEDYRAELQQDEWPLWGHLVLMAVIVVGFFGVYELLGYAAGWLLGTVLPSRSEPAGGYSQGQFRPPE